MKTNYYYQLFFTSIFCVFFSSAHAQVIVKVKKRPIHTRVVVSAPPSVVLAPAPVVVIPAVSVTVVPTPPPPKNVVVFVAPPTPSLYYVSRPPQRTVVFR